MYKFRDILDDASTSLPDLLPKESLKLIQSLRPELAYPSNLRDYIDKIISPEAILLDKNKRPIILNLLPSKFATQLCSHLGSNTEDPYTFLEGHRFNKDKDKEVLLEYFGLEYKREEEKVTIIEKELDCSYGLFDHQINAVNDISEYLSDEQGKAMLHMPTGSGKTRTAVTYASEYLRKNRTTVIWLASQEELCEQAFLEFKKAWSYLGNRKIQIFRLWGKHKVPENFLDGFIVIGLDKANGILNSNHRFFTTLPKNQLVIFDEAHQAIAPTYMRVTNVILNPLGSGKLLGLSATPGRSLLEIEKDEELTKYFNKNKVELKVDGYSNPIDYLIDEGYLAKPNFEYLDGLVEGELSDEEIINLGKSLEISTDLLKKLGRNESRNLKIIDKCHDLVKKHKRIIVFAASVEQSDALAAVMSSEGFNAVSVSSKSSPIDREKFINNYKNDDNEPKIIFNFGILTQGFDAPKTSCVVIARPTKSLVLYSQMTGRALRGKKAEGNKNADIWTVMDKGIDVFNDIAKAFKHWDEEWGS